MSKYGTPDPRRQTGRALQAKRLRLWTAALGACARCRCVCAYPGGFELDHIIALVNGGSDTDDNAQILCAACHVIKTARDLGYKPTIGVDEDGWPHVSHRGALIST